ncbi:MAG: UDP-3-O-[3-hydroxymyristoyl] N-acetylglucosamine deacetylase [Candidatus Atribacteria bacterium]|nr:UDP-3-O-[3-hydroxymyristoyl] N-acetylglucosamine deacetylase [Candidatus Atribacteria bacterium]
MVGKGLHSGKDVRVEIYPAKVNQGIVFHVFQHQKDIIIPAHFHYLHSGNRNSTLTKEGVFLATVEHFLAAAWGVDIDNLLVKVEGEELPAGEGSSSFWTEKFNQVGYKEQELNRTYYQIKEIIEVSDNGRYLLALPSNVFKVTYFLDYFFGSSFALCMTFSENEEGFPRIALARTFAFQDEINHIIQTGLGKGVRDTALIIDEKGHSNKTFHIEGEPVYHKIIDLIGDLMLIGHRVVGHFIGIRSGHSMNHQMVKLVAKKARLFNE